MRKSQPPSRRRVLEAAMSLSAAMGLLPARAHAQPAMMPTASDAEGPFFVANTPVVSNLNRFGKTGEPMRIVGRVLSAAPPHQAIAGAKLQLWQTDGKGKYHPQANGDSSRFQEREVDLRGTLHTDSQGRFEVMSVFPAEYWPRPPHIHYWIHAKGYKPLVTQHYLDVSPGNRPHRTAQVKRSVSPAVFPAPVIYLEPV